MKPSSVTCVVLVTFLVTTATALKCFQCNDCGNSNSTAHECPSGFDACMELKVAGLVDRTCAKKLACGLNSVKRGVVMAWNKLKDLISNPDEAVTDGDVEAQVMQCCDEDYCNGATTSLLNPILLLLLPSLVYFLQF